MPTSTLSTPPVATRKNVGSSATSSGADRDCVAALNLAGAAFDAYLAQPNEADLRHRLAAALRTASDLVAQLPRQNLQAPAINVARELVRKISEGGVAGLVFMEVSASKVQAEGEKYWPHLLARMLLQPAWQISFALTLENVPDWLWGDYAEWIFTAPHRFAATADWELFSTGLIRHLAVLHRWVDRNAGSAAVRAAMEVYTRKASNLPRLCSTSGWKRYAELRGKLLTAFLVRKAERAESVISPRGGRRLRVGFVQMNFGPGSDTFSLLPSFEKLDPQAFEVRLFAIEKSETAEAAYCVRHAESLALLDPTDEKMRIEQLRAPMLDILIFGGNLGAQLNEITRLALHRLAPLQVVNDRSGCTSGLPEVDLYVSGETGETDGLTQVLTERLGQLRGPVHSFNFLQAGEGEPNGFTRESLQVPGDVTLLAAVVTPDGVSRETLLAWVEVLARTEKSKLLVALFAQGPEVAATGFCAVIDALLTARGVATDRVMVCPIAEGAIDEARKILGVADAFLGEQEGIQPVWVAQALVMGLPAVVSGNGGTNGAESLLRSMNLTELVTDTTGHFAQLGADMVENPAGRADLQSRIRTAIANGPDFLDAMAASDGMGTLLETVFDELAALNKKEFRTTRDPLRCFCTDDLTETVEIGLAALERGDVDSASFEATLALRTEPGSSLARLLFGRVLLEQGNPARAVTYLMAAVEGPGGKDTRIWFALAQALKANQQMHPAIQALEVCVQMDGKHVEALLMMMDLAEAVGAAEIAREALHCLQQVAPDDPRVLAMS